MKELREEVSEMCRHFKTPKLLKLRYPKRINVIILTHSGMRVLLILWCCHKHNTL